MDRTIEEKYQSSINSFFLCSSSHLRLDVVSCSILHIRMIIFKTAVEGRESLIGFSFMIWISQELLQIPDMIN